MHQLFTPIAYTSNTITDRKLLEQEIERVRRQGYAVSHEERDEGVSGVAAPIFSGGRLAYCIALGGPSFRFVGNNLAKMIDEITEAVQDITKELAEYEI